MSVIKLAVDIPREQATHDRFIASVRLLRRVFPTCHVLEEGCDLTVQAETEDQLRLYVAFLQCLVNASRVTLTLRDGSVYQSREMNDRIVRFSQ